MTRSEVSGWAAPAFEPVKAAFELALANSEMGAALCVYVDGRPVVDLWAGLSDPSHQTAWGEDTLSVIFSCTKGLVSILAAQLVAEGLLVYEAPVVTYWPEFGDNGKQDITVAELLSHRAGLSAPRVDLGPSDILDWAKVTGILAKQAPLWKPGSGYAYHTITHGWLVGELIRRAGGASVGRLFETRIRQPLQIDGWIGLPPKEASRVARMQLGSSLTAAPVTSPETDAEAAKWLQRSATLGGALPGLLITETGGFNDPEVLAAEIPGAGGVANARALAKIWSATVCETGGVRLLDHETVSRATKVQSEGKPVFPVPGPWPRWGMGFQLDSEPRHYLSAHGFGHDGAGGQVGFAEPGLKIGFGYVTNLMEGAGDQRATSIIDALRMCVKS